MKLIQYFAITNKEMTHIQCDSYTGQLEIYDTMGQAKAQCRDDLRLVPVLLTKMTMEEIEQSKKKKQ